MQGHASFDQRSLGSSPCRTPRRIPEETPHIVDKSGSLSGTEDLDGLIVLPGSVCSMRRTPSHCMASIVLISLSPVATGADENGSDEQTDEEKQQQYRC